MKSNHRIHALIFTLLLLAALKTSAFFDPRIGRLANRDPIAEAGGQNLYGLVQNQTQAKVDIFGYFGASMHDAITQDAIGQANLSTTAKCLARIRNILVRGNVGQDSPLGKGWELRRHFNRGPGDPSGPAKTAYATYLSEELKHFHDLLKKPSKGNCYRSLLSLGMLTHSWEDFYAHAVLETEHGFTFDAWTAGFTGTPDNPGALVPSTYPGEHPIIGEPVPEPKDTEGSEWAARVAAAKQFVGGKLVVLLPVWLGACRCPCEESSWFFVGADEIHHGGADLMR